MQHYTEHKTNITVSRFTFVYGSASHLIIQKQFYTEHRCSITYSTDAALQKTQKLYYTAELHLFMQQHCAALQSTNAALHKAQTQTRITC